jgi:putative CocE/NonD family hydrolase
MHGLRRFTWALALATLTPWLAAGSQNAAQQSPYHRDFGYIPLSDGVRIAYVAYRPSQEGKYPTIMQYDPYVAAGSGPNPGWLDRGYAYIGVSVRGTGCSQGAFSFLNGESHGADGAEIISWIARQSWSNGAVGLWGSSYPAHTAYYVAAKHPPALKAMVTSSITANVYEDALYPGGMFNIGFTSRWFTLYQPALSTVGMTSRIGWGDKECEANAKAHPATDYIKEVQQHRYDDAYWKLRATETYVDRVQVPTIVGMGWQDFQTQITGGITLFHHLKVPKRLYVLPGGHGVVLGQKVFQDDQVRWFDRWLKGTENGVEKEQPVTVFWEVSRKGGTALGGGVSTPNWITTHSAWPVPEAKMQPFYLTGDAQLVTEKPSSGEQAAPRTYTYPTGTELIGTNAQFSVPVEPEGVLVYRSAPMSTDMTILGAPQLTFYVSIQHEDADFVVDLHDLYPNGDVLYLQRGLLRASMRAIDPKRSRPDAIRHLFAKSDPLVPGKIYEIKMSLPPIGAVIREGHRLEVTIMAPSPIAQPDWGFLPAGQPGRNTVYHMATQPSVLNVPVIPGAKAQGPAPACGSTDFQPCRAANTTDQLMFIVKPKIVP